MIMVTYPPALRRTGFVAPRAISRLGAAVMEARAAEQPRPQPPPPIAQVPAPRTTPAPAQSEQPPRLRVVIRLWLPLTPLFLLLAPFALLLSPLIWLAPAPYGRRPFATVFGLGAVLMSLGGTLVDVEARDARIHIRIF